MPIPPPNLDDRDFNQLMEEARRLIEQRMPDWDLSPSNPGTVLLELFAHLTEGLAYRLNRLPDKAYIEFLNLIGTRLHPPTAAGGVLRFSLSQPANQPLEIPRGTRVTVSQAGGEGTAPLYATDRLVVIPAGKSEVEVSAHHCDLVNAELAGVGTGLPGLNLLLGRPPLIASIDDEFDLLVAVEIPPDEKVDSAEVIEHEGKRYRKWREVDNFSQTGPDRRVYVVDRAEGRIYFSPAVRLDPSGDPATVTFGDGALGEIPPAGMEIRAWYRRGGGESGNVAAGTLTVLKDSIPNLSVTNPQACSGGQAAETRENALVRGPQELHSLERAVTARDFELRARYGSQAVARAYAFTQAETWAFARPGTVEVLLAPQVPLEERPAGRVSLESLKAQESELVRTRIEQDLDERRPLGITCQVHWTQYKTVRVKARIVSRRHSDPSAIRSRVIERLNQAINPLPTAANPQGWPFGQALHASQIYNLCQADPGVLWVDGVVHFLVDDVPDQSVNTLAADPIQAHTWYAGAGSQVYRSQDDGDGWEMLAGFSEEDVIKIAVHPTLPGLLAVVTQLKEKADTQIYLSYDCGESWAGPVFSFGFEMYDAAWVMREGLPYLLLAGRQGLYEIDLRPKYNPVQVVVNSANLDMGFSAVVAVMDDAGFLTVAVGALAGQGVFISNQAGRSNSYRAVGLQNKIIQEMAIQQVGTTQFLWAGIGATSGPGEGCSRWELRGLQNPPEGWVAFANQWNAGTCNALAFLNRQLVAGSFRGGALLVQPWESNPPWRAPSLDCGLPLISSGFDTVRAAAANPAGGLVMVSGPQGVFRTQDGVGFEKITNREMLERVTLSPTRLFCSGEHEIEVVSEDETRRD